MLILGIESSCDETAAAVVKDGREVLSNVINTQIALHKKFGGVVPEVASRRHIETIDAVIDVLERLQETYEYVVLLQPTSPLRTAEDIEKAIDKAIASGKDVVSISLVKEHPV